MLMGLAGRKWGLKREQGEGRLRGTFKKHEQSTNHTNPT